MWFRTLRLSCSLATPFSSIVCALFSTQWRGEEGPPLTCALPTSGRPFPLRLFSTTYERANLQVLCFVISATVRGWRPLPFYFQVFCSISRWTYPAKSVEWQDYGKTDISGRGRMCYRIEIPGGSGRQEAAGGLRTFSGYERTERAQLQAAAGGSEDD